MSPERAKVFVVEDDKEWQEIIKDKLEKEGHQVVLSATNLKDALAATNKLTELGVQVATIDGNLTERDCSGKDGQSVLAAISKVASQVKTIGLAVYRVANVDLYLEKDDIDNLGRAVTNI